MTQVHHAPSIYLPRDPGTPVLPDEIRFIGNATTLISIAGFTILTDPNFLHRGERVHLGYGLHSTRRTDPAMEYEDLPPLDAMLLSHLHEDHFDRGVEERLDRWTRIVTTPSAARTLKRRGFHEVMGLRRWGRVRFETGGATLTITALPARHGPRMLSAVLPSVMGSMLEFASAERRPLLRMYISGDTLMHDEIREIPRRFPGIDLALLHLGGTRVFGILLSMEAEQGVDALRAIDADATIPIHYEDYDVFKSPLVDFRRAVQAAGWDDRVRYLRRGDAYRIEHLPSMQ